jgi:hypothetical protein
LIASFGAVIDVMTMWPSSFGRVNSTAQTRFLPDAFAQSKFRLKAAIADSFQLQMHGKRRRLHPPLNFAEYA